MSPTAEERLSRFGVVAVIIGVPALFVTVMVRTNMGSTTPRKRAKSKRAYQLMEERRFTSRARDF